MGPRKVLFLMMGTPESMILQLNDPGAEKVSVMFPHVSRFGQNWKLCFGYSDFNVYLS